MFETLVAAPSPARSRLAAPAAGLGHGLVLAGVLLSAYWHAEDLSPPDPPIFDPGPIIRVQTGPSGGGRQGGSTSPSVHRSPHREVTARTASKEAVPTSLPDKPAASADDSQRQGPESDPTGLPGLVGLTDDDGGVCPACPARTGGGNPAVPLGAPGLVAPVLLLRVEPSYPEAMRRLREEGTVAVEAIIGTDGAIEEAWALTATNALFEAEALRAVKRWRYEPGTRNGRPVRVRLLVSVTFRLR